MSDIERELREILRRQDAPPGFAGRVLRQVEPQWNRWPSPWWSQRWRWIPAAVAASLLVTVSGVYWQRQRQAEQAKEQLMVALQITAQKIALVERAAAKNLRQE